jgi:hypothetical protein
MASTRGVTTGMTKDQGRSMRRELGKDLEDYAKLLEYGENLKEKVYREFSSQESLRVTGRHPPRGTWFYLCFENWHKTVNQINDGIRRHIDRCAHDPMVAMFMFWEQHAWLLNFKWEMVFSTDDAVNDILFNAHKWINPQFKEWWAIKLGSPGCDCDRAGLNRL